MVFITGTVRGFTGVCNSHYNIMPGCMKYSFYIIHHHNYFCYYKEIQASYTYGSKEYGFITHVSKELGVLIC